MKKLIVFVLTLVMCLSLFACGSKEIDVKALADSLKDGITYTDILFDVSDDMISTMYELPETVKGVAYAGSGATAEEVAVFEATDENEAKDVETALKARLDSRADSYASYLPDEVEKIENAVVERCGKYVAMCVSDSPDQASKIISNFFD